MQKLNLEKEALWDFQQVVFLVNIIVNLQMLENLNFR